MNDADIIRELGGPTAVARSLGLEVPNGSRRVHNWIKRGIPFRIKVEHKSLFDKIARKPTRRQASATTQTPATAGEASHA